MCCRAAKASLKTTAAIEIKNSVVDTTSQTQSKGVTLRDEQRQRQDQTRPAHVVARFRMETSVCTFLMYSSQRPCHTAVSFAPEPDPALNQPCPSEAHQPPQLPFLPELLCSSRFGPVTPVVTAVLLHFSQRHTKKTTLQGCVVE